MNKRSMFSLRLKELREESGYTPRMFAEFLNIKLQTYYAYESGKVPSFDVLINIAEKCSISLDWLCGMTDVQKFTNKKNDVATILSQLLTANEMGNHIEVKISIPRGTEECFEEYPQV